MALITPELKALLLQELENGFIGDCEVILDDGTRISMHLCVIEANAQYLYWLAQNIGVMLQDTTYFRVRNVSRNNLLLLRRYIYIGRVVAPTSFLQDLLRDGIMLQVFDALAAQREVFSGVIDVDYYLVYRRTAQEPIIPPGTRFQEDGYNWEVANYILPPQLEEAAAAPAAVSFENMPYDQCYAEWLGLMEYITEQMGNGEEQQELPTYEEAVAANNYNAQPYEEPDWDMINAELDSLNNAPSFQQPENAPCEVLENAACSSNDLDRPDANSPSNYEYDVPPPYDEIVFNPDGYNAHLPSIFDDEAPPPYEEIAFDPTSAYNQEEHTWQEHPIEEIHHPDGHHCRHCNTPMPIDSGLEDDSSEPEDLDSHLIMYAIRSLPFPMCDDSLSCNSDEDEDEDEEK